MVETICGGLEIESAPDLWLSSRAMGNDLTKRLMWSGLLAGVGALATIVANRDRHATSGSRSSTRTRPSD